MELFAELVAAAPGAVEDVIREIKSGLPEETRDKFFGGFPRLVRFL